MTVPRPRLIQLLKVAERLRDDAVSMGDGSDGLDQPGGRTGRHDPVSAHARAQPVPCNVPAPRSQHGTDDRLGRSAVAIGRFHERQSLRGTGRQRPHDHPPQPGWPSPRRTAAPGAAPRRLAVRGSGRAAAAARRGRRSPAPAAAPVPADGAERISFGLNPLVAAAAPLLQLLGRLRNTYAQPNADDLRERTVQQVRAFEQAARDGGVPIGPAAPRALRAVRQHRRRGAEHALGQQRLLGRTVAGRHASTRKSAPASASSSCCPICGRTPARTCRCWS